MEDLIETDKVVKSDPGVIEQCGILGIPPEDMHKIYADRTHYSFITWSWHGTTVLKFYISSMDNWL